VLPILEPAPPVLPVTGESAVASDPLNALPVFVMSVPVSELLETISASVATPMMPSPTAESVPQKSCSAASAIFVIPFDKQIFQQHVFFGNIVQLFNDLNNKRSDHDECHYGDQEIDTLFSIH
jgi:hypothetical protein